MISLVVYPWVFFGNGSKYEKERREKEEKKRKEFWDANLKDNPNFLVEMAETERIWSAENVINVLKEKSKKYIPVYKYEVISDEETVCDSYQDIKPKLAEIKKIFVGYKEIK